MNKPIRVAIAGANGRMGKELIRACLADNQIELSAALLRASHPLVGEPVAKLLVNSQHTVLCQSQDTFSGGDADVLIDFTLPANTLNNLQTCIKDRIPMVIGTTGFTPQQQSIINEAAAQIPLLQASNMSVGVNLTLALLRKAARTLGDEAKVEIVETHHIHKLDSPSGTAISMAKEIADTMGTREDSIDIQSIREGEVVGDHRVSFSMEGEQIEISHHAESRQIFARGALKAASWLSDKSPGLYSMDDVLGL